MIALKQASFHYKDRVIIDQFSYMFASQKIYGIIGPNGAGKTTLLQMIAGLYPPSSGQVTLDNKPINHYSKKQLAQMIAVLQQGGLPPLSYTVREIVEMGRYPYQNWLGTDRNDAAHYVNEALELTGITHLQHRRLEQLSGGERQRVALAKVFVQEPNILLLDEPTTYLDIGNQQMIMDFVKRWQVNYQLTVIAVLHDLNTAALYCDELIALKDGALVVSGQAGQVLTKEYVSQLYEAETVIITHPLHQVPQLLLKESGEK